MAINYLKELQSATSLKDISILLEVDEHTLNYLLYKAPDDQLYYTFKIAKKDGGTREIHSPIPELKRLQKKLGAILSSILEPDYQFRHKEKRFKISDKATSREYPNKSVSHAFKQRLSISTNAENHLRKRYVFNLDLQDFFGSINFGRVRGFFIKDKQFKLQPTVATHLANIICYKNKIPQGSPCSPVVSNLIARSLDRHLLKIAKKNRCFYTRYADDLTFSTNEKKFPEDLAFFTDSQWRVGASLDSVIMASGFRVKISKIRMHYRASRQMVTGLIVNHHVNVPAEYYRQTRSMCLNLFTKGKCHLKTDPEKDLSLSQLEGRLNYIYQIRKFRNAYANTGYRKTKHNGKQREDSKLDRSTKYSDVCHQTSLDGIKNLYCRFLYYKYFFAPTAPLIFCEGKTDPIYLKCALLSSALSFPSLVASNRIKFSFFSANQLDGEMMKIADGTGGMKYLIASYLRMKKECKIKELPRHPIILIVDNDKAGLDVKSSAPERCIIAPGIIHARQNLYILEIPHLKPNTTNTTIEDYFTEKVRQMNFKGKTFKADTAGDTSNHFGKAVFAMLIKKRRKKIDFSNFTKIFDLINQVIDHYNSVLASQDSNIKK